MAEGVLDYDIVIVGSGAGGGTVAKELAPMCEQGFRIALLDRGGRFAKEDNTRREFEMAGKYFFDNGGFQTSSQDMTLAFCKAIGGTTNVYTGVTFDPPADVLHDKWAVDGVTLDDLQPRLDKFKAENNVHLQRPANINRNNELFAEGCRELGWEVGQFPLNIKGCAGLNTCNLGCARHAKQGTAQVQIPVAEKKGVEVIPFCRVDRIDGRELAAEILPPEHGLGASALEPGSYRIRAKRIVLAAGAINTPTLMMRSARGWQRRWPALGRYFTCHPALTLVADHDEVVGGSQGHPKSYFCDDFVDSHGFLLETCFYFPFTTSKNLVGFGPEVDELMGRTDHMQQVLVLAMDRARSSNRVAVDRKGNPVVHYEFEDRVLDAFVESIRTTGRLFFAAGARRAHLPAADRFFTTPEEAERLDEIVRRDRFKLGQVAIQAAHLMGGCRMGADPRLSVADGWGRVHGEDGIYVADASLFPDSVEVNPYLTIMALADRVAEGIRHEVGAA